MEKTALIKKTVSTLLQLPQEKIREILDFADYISKKYEEDILRKGTEKLVENSKAFEFLREEEDIYSFEDLKEKYR
ncbi:MAG TPA: hypothetical protein VFM65_03605 [Flavobacteriaceae bacterium]|nr:hypothetical protein [Flavobacteriaceae bacterium]